jgi:hypothetical protein
MYAGVEKNFGQAQAQGFLNFFNPNGSFPEHSRQRRPKEIYLSMSFEMFSFVSPYHT